MSSLRYQIELGGQGELARWLEELGCSEDELRAATTAVGLDATHVRAHIQRQRLRRSLARMGYEEETADRSSGADDGRSLHESVAEPIGDAHKTQSTLIQRTD